MVNICILTAFRRSTGGLWKISWKDNKYHEICYNKYIYIYIHIYIYTYNYIIYMYIWNIISISWRLHVSEFCVSQVSHALYLPDLMLQLDCLSLHWYHEQCPTLLSQRQAKAKARFKYLILVLQVHLKTEFSNIFWSSLIFRRPHHAIFRPFGTNGMEIPKKTPALLRQAHSTHFAWQAMDGYWKLGKAVKLTFLNLHHQFFGVGVEKQLQNVHICVWMVDKGIRSW